MFSAIVLACLIVQQPAQTPAPTTRPVQSAVSPRPVPGLPTPWFDKDEDTFDLPADPKHLADIKRDVEEGKKDAQEVLKEEKASTNMAYQERVERIGQQIAHIANHMHAVALWGDKRFSPYHYRYTVLQGDDVNAFSLPGGYIFVYEGLMRFVESDDELAGVLGHETAHAAFRHVATLEHDSNRALAYEIPIMIAAMLAHSPETAIGSSLVMQSFQSGWSIDAEKAADYGGFQFLTKSPYNPVAMLTFMERLSRQDRYMDAIVRNTIMQTHPVTRDRVLAFTDDLKNAGIPIERSKASPSFRVLLKSLPDGSVDALFDGIKIYKFAGPNAMARAQACAKDLNKFYDAVPPLYDVTKDASLGTVEWKGHKLITVDPADAAASKCSVDDLLDKTMTAIKGSLFDLDYRISIGPDY